MKRPKKAEGLVRWSGGTLGPSGKVLEHERLTAFNLAAERCGTIFEPASSGHPMRIGGAMTKHPLARPVAMMLVAEIRKLGGEAKAFPCRSGFRSGTEANPLEDFVYLSGCSFSKTPVATS